MELTPEQLQAYEKALKLASEYTGFIFKGSLEQFGGMLTDTMQHFRFRNQLRLLVRTAEIMKERGYTPQRISPSVSVPLIEEAANTDDPEISEMFARLLAAHLDATNDEVHPSFAKTLGQLSPLDVKVLLLVDEKECATEDYARRRRAGMEAARRDGTLEGIGPEKRQRWINEHFPLGDLYHCELMDIVEDTQAKYPDAKPRETALSVFNLHRLGLLRDDSKDFQHPEADSRYSKGITVSPFGQRLISACSKVRYWRPATNEAWEKSLEERRKPKWVRSLIPRADGIEKG